MFSLGFDIGGTKCAVILGKDKMPENGGELIIDKITFPTNSARGWRAVTAEMLSAADSLLCRNGIDSAVSQLCGIGISCGGPLDSKKGIICSPPNLPDWDNVPICSIFEEHFGIRPVLKNDADACAAAEWKFGAGKGTENMIFLTFGTGMGAGLILNGQLYSGSLGLAGEAGHIRLSEDGPEGYGKKGSFEGFCSGAGIEKLAKAEFEYAEKRGIATLLDKNDLSAKAVAAAAVRGDETAKRIYGISAEKLGMGLALLIDLLNPDAIIIGSIYARQPQLFNGIIKKIISREALEPSHRHCRILPAVLGDSIGDYAALSLAIKD